ncbi:MAG: PAC2 family protein [Candidatus Thorarchaeota archaeon]
MYARRFMELGAESLKSPIGIVALPGIANVGKIAIETLSQLLRAEHFMDLFSKDFPPRVLVRKGIASIPKTTVHLYRAAPDEPHDLLFLTADFQPSSSTGVYEYADFVAKEFEKMGVTIMYSLAAYEQDYAEYFKSYPNEPRIYVSASTEELLARLSDSPHAVVTEEGVIVGANGVIPTWASSMYSMEGACILGETLGVIKVDYRAAKAILEKLIDLVGINVDLDIMTPHISKVIEFIEWARKEIARKAETTEDGENPSDMYIG